MIKSSILHKTSDGKEFRGMKHSIKKGISLVLALSLCVSLGMESALALTPQPSSAGAAAQNTSAEQAPIETVSDAADITAMVQNYWEDSFFEEVVINPNRETVTKDGTETTLEQALDLSHAEAEAVLESPNAAADYFSNSVYDSQNHRGRSGCHQSAVPDHAYYPVCRHSFRHIWRGGSPALPRL